ncbi:hypothetical protein AZE42_12758 [Rhizopogon vesiculosus]|uniref:Uncharacterized protein n=1 Tax=Rhizopogon vesiculosus TaxID=180088 RepID=A0A1J8QQV8_9AGAM|nr:hypothetical protein AZE42_12758 [Rhizopogon vesiculosus]
MCEARHLRCDIGFGIRRKRNCKTGARYAEHIIEYFDADFDSSKSTSKANCELPYRKPLNAIVGLACGITIVGLTRLSHLPWRENKFDCNLLSTWSMDDEGFEREETTYGKHISKFISSLQNRPPVLITWSFVRAHLAVGCLQLTLQASKSLRRSQARESRLWRSISSVKP